MITSYLKLAFRNLYKYKLYSIINVVGLSVAIAVCVVAYVNYQFSKSYDKFHQNIDRIYHVNSYKILNNNRINWSISPVPFGPAIRHEIPGIERVSRMHTSSGMLRYGDKVFNESLFYADKDFFEIFSFTLVSGDKDVLADKSAVVITRRIAEKYFGDENPLGKQVTISFDGQEDFEFVVGAVAENHPNNSSVRFSVLLPFERLKDMHGFDLESWERWSRATFILTSDNASPAQIEEQLQAYKQIANEANPDWQIEGYYLLSMYDLAMESREMHGDLFYGSMPMSAIVGPSVTAVLILLLACFNYVNTAIASASRRLKEIGIRKVVGGVRKQLILQFLGENLVLCFVALLVGIGLAEIFVPAYDSLWPDITLTMNYEENTNLLVFLIGLLLFTAIAAGAYPAFYISGFNPVSIFRGKQKLGGTNPLIRILLTLQFALSMTAIIMGVVFNKNAQFIKTTDMGFDREQIIVVPVKGESAYSLYKNAIKDHPEIVKISGSRNHIATSWSRADIESGDIKSEVTFFRVGENYFKTMGLELVDGRLLNPDLQTDIDQAIIVNETLMNEFGWTSFADQFIKIKDSDNDKEYKVIGVVRDFKYQGLWRKVQPTILGLATPENYRYLAVKFDSENIRGIADYLQAEWKSLFPNLPYNGFFQDELQAEEAMVTNSIRIIAFYIAVIAILLSAMGLFAMVSLNIAKRTKELGIRKILGASMLTVGGLISREFLWLLLIASGLAAAMGFFMVDALLSSIYAYHTDFGFSPFVLASGLITMIALITVSSQIFKIATTNPVDAIRNE